MSESLAALDFYATQVFATGREPEDTPVGVEAIRARLIKSNGREAEALSCVHNYHLVEKLRSLLMRGKLVDAEDVVNELVVDPINEEKVDVFLEVARLRTYQGRWLEAISVLQNVEQHDPSLVSRMAFLQVRALSFFELGKFEKALRDLDTLDSLGTMLIHSQTFFYGQVLRVKILSRTRGPIQGRSALNKIWTSVADSQVGIQDRILTLLRAELDLQRILGKSSAEIAAFCFSLSEIMGDDLFQALATVDIAYSVSESSRQELRPTLDEIRKRFKRVDSLLNSIEGDDRFQSTTGASILNGKKFSENCEGPNIESLLQGGALWLENLKLLINLKPFRVIAIQKKPQLITAMKTLLEGPCSLPDLFSKTHPGRKYTPRLHEGVMHVLLSRLRKELSLNIITKDGLVIVHNLIAFMEDR